MNERQQFVEPDVDIIATAFPEVKVIPTERFQDERGFFSETFSRRTLSACGIDLEFVQDNFSASEHKGTVRGLHYQVPPHAQAKLVRVVRGAILDVAVDIRAGSPTEGKHVAEVLSADNWNQMFIPVGFAHGFCTLEPRTQVFYKATDFYAPECERGILWNDPELGIDWPVGPSEALLSDKDRQLPALRDLEPCFRFGDGGS